MTAKVDGLSGADALAAGALALFAAPILTAYVLDLAGVRFLPVFVAPFAMAIAVAVFAAMARRAAWRTTDTCVFLAILAVTFGSLMWFARGGIFPPGRGSDLTHHLMLIDYIDAHWHLPNEPDAEAQLGIMAPYTPGVHLLASFAGWTTRGDGLHAVYSVVAASVALKAGLIFLIGMRITGSIPLAIGGVALLFVPREYSLGSFVEFSFFAQVVAELFAAAMWWSLLLWTDGAAAAGITLFAVSGAAAFLTWPVLAGPLALAAVCSILLRRDESAGRRIRQLTLAGAPIAIVTGLYILRHGHWLGMVRTGGAVVWPSASQYGWWFLALSVAGVPVLTTSRAGRVTLAVAACVALQTLVLWRLAAASGADTPYLALKMLYFAVGLQAIAACAALAWLCRPFALPALPWLSALVLIVVAGRPLAAARRPIPLMSEDLFQAGVWAREHVPPNCVDYLTGDDGTAYWLHLAVLRNRWLAPRTGMDTTYHPRDAIVRWLTPGGLPYAIADLPALPSDVRRDLDIVSSFGTAAVVKRRGPSSCDQHAEPR